MNTYTQRTTATRREPKPEMLSHCTTATITALAATLVALFGPWMLLLAVPMTYLTCMRGDTTQRRALRLARRR